MNETLKPVCPHNPDIECPCPKDGSRITQLSNDRV